jgi:hypothetical protein
MAMQPSEREQWVKVADALGFVIEDDRRFTHKNEINRYYAVDYPHDAAMLHGLACIKCNGRAWWAAGGSVWYWDINGDTGEAKSQPAALLAMLEAHGGEG